MKIERIKRYEKDPPYRDGLMRYQDTCRFYFDEWEVFDLCLSACNSAFDVLAINTKSFEELCGIMIKLENKWINQPKENKLENRLQKEENMIRLRDWMRQYRVHPDRRRLHD